MSMETSSIEEVSRCSIKIILDDEGEIPKVFRTGLLKSDSASSLSRLMSEIEKYSPLIMKTKKESYKENYSNFSKTQTDSNIQRKEGIVETHLLIA